MERIILSILLLSLCSCSQQPANQVGDAEYQRQINIYDEQAARTDSQLDRTDEQLNRTDLQLKKSAEQGERLDSLLKKWEDQAAQQDRILNGIERVLKKSAE